MKLQYKVYTKTKLQKQINILCNDLNALVAKKRIDNAIHYSRFVYGNASHMRDFPHCVNCMLKCHIFSESKMW